MALVREKILHYLVIRGIGICGALFFKGVGGAFMKKKMKMMVKKAPKNKQLNEIETKRYNINTI